MRRASGWTMAVSIGALAGMLVLGCGGTRPADLGEVAGSLRACPSSPNCVSSDARDPGHFVLPIGIEGSPAAAFEAVREVIRGWSRCTIVQDEPDYLHVECKSAVFRFVDDLELVLRAERAEIAVRSASRRGYWDLGANRHRVEDLRAALVARGVASPARPASSPEGT